MACSAQGSSVGWRVWSGTPHSDGLGLVLVLGPATPQGLRGEKDGECGGRGPQEEQGKQPREGDLVGLPPGQLCTLLWVSLSASPPQAVGSSLVGLWSGGPGSGVDPLGRVPKCFRLRIGRGRRQATGTSPSPEPRSGVFRWTRVLDPAAVKPRAVTSTLALPIESRGGTGRLRIQPQASHVLSPYPPVKVGEKGERGKKERKGNSYPLSDSSFTKLLLPYQR